MSIFMCILGPALRFGNFREISAGSLGFLLLHILLAWTAVTGSTSILDYEVKRKQVKTKLHLSNHAQYKVLDVTVSPNVFNPFILNPPLKYLYAPLQNLDRAQEASRKNPRTRNPKPEIPTPSTPHSSSTLIETLVVPL